MREICMSGSMSGMWKRVMVEPLRHRQTKEAATDMFDLQPPRHISTLHTASNCCGAKVRTRWERSGHAESVGSGSI